MSQISTQTTMMTMRAQKGTPLPPNIYPSGDFHSAYARCVELEKAVDDIPLADLRKRLREARVLGYMIREAPSEEGRANISKGILDCTDDLELSSLADFYINHIFLNFRAAKASTPTPSRSSSHPSFDNDQDMLKWLLEEAPKSHSSTKAKALFRDGYRCVLTGHYDQVSVDTIPNVWTEFLAHGNRAPCSTNLARILPEYNDVNLIFADDEDGQNNNEMWFALERFADGMITRDFKIKDADSLNNVLTLENNKYNLFNELKIWFEEVRGADGNIYPHQYRIGSANPFTQLMDVSPIVSFSTPDGDNLPLPNPRYLKVHAACARVAYLSGVGKYIDDIFTSTENRLALTSDGSSADVFGLATLLSDKISVAP